ncbi:MAG: hypothetical protein IKY45_05260 [Clostridia bacterium]|nr:hypothetical protein [Clostridia bacterium]
MADELTYNGLSTKTNIELLEEIQTFLQTNYSPNGETIDFSSGSPDGQFSEILANIGTVHRELLTAIYNATDPSKCDGAQQDNKYQLNYVFRKGGTYTTQNISITATKTVTLQGLDGSYNDNTASAFTVSDDAGNLWFLVDTTTVYAGITSLEFRAKEIGAVVPTIGTITNIVTVTEGISAVNNIVGYTTLGTEQESNLSFRIRRDRSTGNQSGNNSDSIEGNILALDGVNACRVWVNDTDTTDSTSTLPHYIWCIVDGGAQTEIADIIYANKGGCGTRGSVTVPISTVSAQVLNINFDRPTVKPLFIKFDLQITGDAATISQIGLKKYIAENLIYELSEDAETSKITTVAANALLAQNGQAYALNVEISSGGTATASVTGTITAATVDVTTFQSVMGNISTGSYVFTYTASGWTYSGNVVEISDYGITITGTPAENDTVTISFTAGSWTDFIPVTSLADIFATDENKIYISVVE